MKPEARSLKPQPKPRFVTWTMEAASREFGRSRTTVSARLAESGTKPDEDGRFTTKQICDALFGSAHAARCRESQARAELAEARTSILQKKWLPADLVEKAWSFTVRTVRQRLLEVPYTVASGKPELEKRIRQSINIALEELSKMELPSDFENFDKTKNEKMENDNEDTNESE